jgi:UDP-N-acetylglucosamine transferase subunit ALG13
MNQEYINNPGEQLFILLSPLDWGLGHATRCIPLIYSLRKYRATVILAAEGPVAALLQQEFPGLQVLPLNGYRISYAPGRKGFFLKILTQLPKIQSAINQENKWLNKLNGSIRLHGIISDNRMGLYSKRLPSVYITHQLKIDTGLPWLNKAAQAIHYQFINRFSECWVPDQLTASGSLAGALSHPLRMPGIPVKYLGALSRFKRETNQGQTYDLLLLLSGPEPQRTVFENILLNQLPGLPGKVAFVRGLPGEQKKLVDTESVTFFNHLAADELNKLINQSSLVIARAGYSTIMDLAALQKKVILVPTPGQGEQEYLAGFLHDQGFCYACRQEDFLLEDILKKAGTFSFSAWPLPEADYDKVVYEWLLTVRQAAGLQ